MSNKHTPPANALHFTAYDQECALYINEIFQGQLGLKCVYKKDNKWFWISEPSIFEVHLDTKENTDEVYQNALEEINVAMEELFGKATDEPEKGRARLEWLIQEQTIVVKNNLRTK